MVYVIMSSDVDRNQGGRSWITKGITFSISSALAATATGAVLGGIGTLIPIDVRIGLATVLAVPAVALGLIELTQRSVPVPQRDRETSQRWMQSGALRGAARNGLALGLGFSTRIGFWLWYAIPTGAVLTGDWRVGAALYGTYGVARGLAPWEIVGAGRVIRRMRNRETDLGWWLVERGGVARGVAAAQLGLLGMTVGIGLG